MYNLQICFYRFFGFVRCFSSFHRWVGATVSTVCAVWSQPTQTETVDPPMGTPDPAHTWTNYIRFTRLRDLDQWFCVAPISLDKDSTNVP